MSTIHLARKVIITQVAELEIQLAAGVFEESLVWPMPIFPKLQQGHNKFTNLNLIELASQHLYVTHNYNRLHDALSVSYKQNNHILKIAELEIRPVCKRAGFVKPHWLGSWTGAHSVWGSLWRLIFHCFVIDCKLQHKMHLMPTKSDINKTKKP